jgi:hypothetical protein
MDRLKRLYPRERLEAIMPADRFIYVDTSFNYLRPLLLPYKDVERCLSEEIPRRYEEDVMEVLK